MKIAESLRIIEINEIIKPEDISYDSIKQKSEKLKRKNKITGFNLIWSKREIEKIDLAFETLKNAKIWEKPEIIKEILFWESKTINFEMKIEELMKKNVKLDKVEKNDLFTTLNEIEFQLNKWKIISYICFFISFFHLATLFINLLKNKGKSLNF